MAQVGCLGEILFTVSSGEVKTIDKASWSGSARYSTHQRHMTDALVEFTGLEPDTFSFDMLLSGYLGVDVSAEIAKLWQYERIGKAVPLVIGDRGYGKYRWVIKSHKVKLETYDKRGNLTSATVSVSLLEYK